MLDVVVCLWYIIVDNLYKNNMRFSKMHGLGNDFVIVDAVTQNVKLTLNQIKKLSNRFYGIGFDQLLIVEPSGDPKVDFYCHIYNADGSEVNQCGNGIRCVARFVYIKKLINKSKICISTYTNSTTLYIKNNDFVSSNMGEPIFDTNIIPFYALQNQKNYILFLPQEVVLCGVVSIGNPHCVILVESIESAPVIRLGSILEKHHRFPNKVNVSFMQIINQKKVKLRVYERGVGETQSCGSAACAAVALGIQQGLLNKCELVQVEFLGGSLLISWKGIGYPLYMTGSATYIYDGLVCI